MLGRVPEDEPTIYPISPGSLSSEGQSGPSLFHLQGEVQSHGHNHTRDSGADLSLYSGLREISTQILKRWHKFILRCRVPQSTLTAGGVPFSILPCIRIFTNSRFPSFHSPWGWTGLVICFGQKDGVTMCSPSPKPRPQEALYTSVLSWTPASAVRARWTGQLEATEPEGADGASSPVPARSLQQPAKWLQTWGKPSQDQQTGQGQQNCWAEP